MLPRLLCGACGGAAPDADDDAIVGDVIVVKTVHPVGIDVFLLLAVDVV
jgi:hypothetical protein